MVVLKSLNWNDNLSEKLNGMRRRGLFSDVLILPCEKNHDCVQSQNTTETTSFLSYSSCDNVLKTKMHQSNDNCLKSNVKNIAAHSVVLAANSTFLCQILTSSKILENVKTIHVHNISFKIWEYILQFIYCGEISVTQSDIEDLKNAAIALDIKDLVSVILNLLEESTDIHSKVEKTKGPSRISLSQPHNTSLKLEGKKCIKSENNGINLNFNMNLAVMLSKL